MIHEDLIERFALFFSRMPTSIYELGSRDGEDRGSPRGRGTGCASSSV